MIPFFMLTSIPDKEMIYVRARSNQHRAFLPFYSPVRIETCEKLFIQASSHYINNFKLERILHLEQSVKLKDQINYIWEFI